MAAKEKSLDRLRYIIDQLLDPDHEGISGQLIIHRGKQRGAVRIEADIIHPVRLQVTVPPELAADVLAASGIVPFVEQEIPS